MAMQKHGPLLACLTAFLCLSGCATAPVVRTETVTVHTPVIVPVPVVLTNPVPSPAMNGDTNGALADYIASLQVALQEANAKLRQIAGLAPKGK